MGIAGHGAWALLVHDRVPLIRRDLLHLQQPKTTPGKVIIVNALPTKSRQSIFQGWQLHDLIFRPRHKVCSLCSSAAAESA